MRCDWPKGKHIAVLFDVMFEGWGVNKGPAMGPMGNPIKPGYQDTANIGFGQYAFNNGIQRLLKVFEEEGLQGSAFVSGTVMEQRPDLVRMVAESGHELVLHGDLQDELPIYLDEEIERAKIKKCIHLMTELGGKKPVGYGSPRFTDSLNTRRILVENGIQYSTDWLGSDLPVVETTEAGDICRIPFTMNVNDMPISMRFGQAAHQYYDVLVDEFEGWYKDHPEEKAVVWVTAHTHVFGRPYGAAQFKKAMQYIKSIPYVWIARPHEVAATVMDINY